MADFSNAYVPFGQVQKYVADYFFKFGKKRDLSEAVRDLYIQEQHLVSKPDFPRVLAWSQLSDRDFADLLNQIPLPVHQLMNIKSVAKMQESNILPDGCDVTVGRTCAFEDNTLHSHDFFEICFVYQGTCQFQYEKEQHTLKEGEMCIIAPLNMHTVFVEETNSIVFGIAIRKSTFDSAFFSLLSQRDLLSCFFRTLLYSKTKGNYLRFFTNNSAEIKLAVRNLIIDSYFDDSYANNRCISWINILFSDVLRNYSHTIRFYNYDLAADFSLVLQYIQHNYRTLTLKTLADYFHYNVTHLSTLIKKNTGSNFIDLITDLKMADSIEYLTNTNSPIEKIAEYVGYSTADHFSRIFKKHYQCSPQQYRKSLRA